jgi:threonine/homoserine/homoserine lactone efflux protein
MLSSFSSLAFFALAGAISTVPVSVTILILLSPNPRRGALPFLIGSLLGSLVVVGLSAVGLQLAPLRPPRLRRDEWVAQIAVVTGAILIAYSVYLFVSKDGRDNAMLGKMESRFRSARPWEYIVLGLGLNLRPKAILLAVTAGAVISVQELAPLPSSLLILAYASVVQSAVIIPVAVWLRSPERAQVPLAALFNWLQRNGRRIAAIATLTIGIFLVGYSFLQL